MKIFERGLLPFDPVKHALRKSTLDYGFTFPVPMYPIDKSGGITDFGMGGNGPDPTLTVNKGQPVGDCGPNAVPKNANLVDAVLTGLAVTDYTMTSDEIVTLYFEYTGGQDTGVDLGDWLMWLFKKGLIKGFVKLNLSDMDAALALGFAVVVGVSLNRLADDQVIQGVPWDVGPGDEPDPNEGHAILRLAAESATGNRTWASWGQRVISTYDWDQACVQEAFGVVTNPDALEKNGFPVAALIADLVADSGTVASLPAEVLRLESPSVVALAPVTPLQPNVVKAIVRSIMPFIISAFVAVCIHFGYHPTAQTITWVLGAGGGGLTILLHLLEKKWPMVGILLGYIGAPVYTPPKRVLQSNKISQLETQVATLTDTVNALRRGGT